ncbi:hypothetical protein [Pseudoalteromonas gelatinilytica]
MELELDDLSTGMTGFIDILGFSAKVSGAETIEDVRDIHKCIKIVQDNFEFLNNDNMTTQVHELNGKKVLAFSDCVVINIPLDSESTKYSGSFDPIMMELLNLAFAQGMCVHQNLFIRGGLDLGWWYNQEDTLISSGLVTSAKREESANVPVIALCENLYKYFEKHPDRNTYSKEIDPIPAMFKFYEDEKTSFYFLDYIYLCLNNMDWCPTGDERVIYQQASEDEKDNMRNEGYQNMIDRWLRCHARIIEQAAGNVSDIPKIYSKYIWLSQYHNETVKGFTSNSECVCNVG